MSAVAVSGPDTGSHRVQFYDHERQLAESVSAFLAEGLRAGEPAVMIATQAHSAAIASALAITGIDVAAQIGDGRLVMLDAEATLAKLLVGDMPEWQRFAHEIGGLLQRIKVPGRAVRAYGEMVDVLWRAGRQRTAIALEEMWNQLGDHHRFDLLCGYGVDAVRSVDGVRDICRQHTHVIPLRSRVSETEIQAVVTEIARRTEVEAELRERSEDLQDFLDNAAVAIHRVDQDGVIRWANHTELELLGYTADEYVGRHIRDFHVDRAVIDDILARLKRGETIRDYEARLRTKDGSVRHVAISSNFQLRRGGTTRCFARDITAQKQAEAEREAASRAKDEFLAVLGHELRNPLSPILTAVQLMRLRGETSSAREQDVIERQVNYLVRLVDDLLDISRISRGKVQLDRRPTKLGPLVTRALEVVSPLCEERRHRVEVSIPPEPIWIDADETRICQVLTNLLTNAAKYTPNGGEIAVRVSVDARTVRIAVRDNGVGITPELLPVVFDPFVQGARSTERSRGGLGIGLAIVRNLVGLHGGTVTATSGGSGHGSELVVELPALRLEREPAQPSEPDLRQRVAVTPRRILVVDDNEDACMLLGEMLRKVGHEVHIAIDGPRALEVVKHFRPEVAILDIGLPVMDGYELAEALRGRLGSSLRMMAVTGYGQDRDRERAERAGFVGHFVKPIGLGKVLAAIEVAAESGEPE